MNGLALRPPTEPILTIRPGSLGPVPRAPTSGAKAWVAMTTPVRLTSSCLRHSSIDRCSSGPATAMPALLTNPAKVSPPSTASTCRAASRTAAWSVTSKISGVTASPNAATRRSASALFRTPANTWSPRWVSTWVTAQPMPVEAPVTTTDLRAWAMCSLPFVRSRWGR